MKIGDYEIVEYIGKLNPKRNDNYYKMRCTICGEERIAPKTLKDGFSKNEYFHNNKTCVNHFRNAEIGTIYGDYEVIGYELINNEVKYKVKCLKCNRIKTVYIKHLKNGFGTSHQSCIKSLNGVDKRFYEIWGGMIKRTTNPKCKNYKNYGGRGIKSDKYKFFIDFYDDLFDSYIKHCKEYGVKNTTLDRIDVNGDYVKENIRWATVSQQNKNTRKQLRKSKAIDPEGNEYIFSCAKDFAKQHNMNATYIYNVLNGRQKTYKGWKFERI